MAKQKAASQVSFLQDLLHFGVYKRNQGKIVRQATFAAMAMTFLIGSWRLYAALDAADDQSWYAAPGMEYLLPGLLLAIGTWVSFRLVNYPPFADFLVAVEAEMNKVSWPSRQELIRASLVVIFVMFFLAIILFTFDLIWQALFKLIGVIP